MSLSPKCSDEAGRIQAMLPLWPVPQKRPRERQEESVKGNHGRSGPQGPRAQRDLTSWAQSGEVLVTHKRITVILLTLTLELLLKDGNRSRRLIKNAPDFPRRPWLTTVPKVP